MLTDSIENRLVDYLSYKDRSAFDLTVNTKLKVREKSGL